MPNLSWRLVKWHFTLITIMALSSVPSYVYELNLAQVSFFSMMAWGVKFFRAMSFLPWIHFYHGYTFKNEHHKNQSTTTDCNYFFSGAHHALIQIIKSCLGPQRNKHFSPLTTEYKCERNWFGDDDIFTHPTESGIPVILIPGSGAAPKSSGVPALLWQGVVASRVSLAGFSRKKKWIEGKQTV